MKLLAFVMKHFHRRWQILLFHDQEESAVVAQTSRVESGWQHIWILFLGAWQQRDVCRESPVDRDHVGVRRQSSGQDSKMSACTGITIIHGRQQLPGMNHDSSEGTCTHPESSALFPALRPEDLPAPAPATWTLILPRLTTPPANIQKPLSVLPLPPLPHRWG